MGISGTGDDDRMNEELLVDARMRTLCMLSGPTIHELRGAANVLALHLQLLAIEPTDDDAVERRRRSLAAVDDGRRRLFDIAETFVRHATLPDARDGEFDLARVADQAVALARPYAMHRRVDMTLEPSPAAAPVSGRRDVVSQTLLDLLLAMLERLPQGSKLDVVVTPGSRDAQAVLRPSLSEAVPDAEVLARAASAVEWAGGTLRVDDGSVIVQLPISLPGDPDEG